MSYNNAHGTKICVWSSRLGTLFSVPCGRQKNGHNLIFWCNKILRPYRTKFGTTKHHRGPVLIINWCTRSKFSYRLFETRDTLKYGRLNVNLVFANSTAVGLRRSAHEKVVHAERAPDFRHSRPLPLCLRRGGDDFIKFVQDSLTRKALRGALNPCAHKLSDFTIGFS